MLVDFYSREETAKLRAGVIISVILLVLIVWFASMKAKIQNDEAKDLQSYPLLARFNRTDGLLVGNAVRMAGVTIGSVAEAKLDDHFKAILTLNINEGVQIPLDSNAYIVSSAIMGPKYIEVVPGGDVEFMEPMNEFEYTQDAMVVEELLDRIIGIGKANRAKKCVKE